MTWDIEFDHDIDAPDQMVAQEVIPLILDHLEHTHPDILSNRVHSLVWKENGQAICIMGEGLVPGRSVLGVLDGHVVVKLELEWKARLFKGKILDALNEAIKAAVESLFAEDEEEEDDEPDEISADPLDAFEDG